MFWKTKKTRLSELAAALLRRVTSENDPDRAVADLVQRFRKAQKDANKLADRLYEMQKRVEASQEELNRREETMREVGEAAGLDVEDPSRWLQDRVRFLRRQADLLATFREVSDGNFDPDRTLLRRLACCLGTSHMEPDALIERANGILVENENLRRAQKEED